MFRKGLMEGQGRHSLAQPGRNRRRIKSHRCANLERRNTIGGGELVELPLAYPQKSSKFRNTESLRFFLQDFHQVHGLPFLWRSHKTQLSVPEKRTVVVWPLF